MRDGWVETNLLDVVEVLDRFRKPINATERESRQGAVPYYGANGQTGWIDDYLFDEELVLLGEDAIDFADPTARKAYLIAGPSWVNNHAHVLRAKIDKVESYFLAESLNKVDFSQYVSFGTRSKLTQASMNGITIPLPPLPEQKRIVDLVSSVDSYIEALQQQLESAKSSRNAVLHELLIAGGDDWVETTLGEAAEVIMGRQLSPSKKLGTRPRPYIRAANIGAWGINLEDIYEMDFTEIEEERFACQVGDTILVEGGNEKSVGCPALITEKESGLCIQNTVIRSRSRNSKALDPNFQYHLLRFMFWRGDFAQLCAGTTIMHLGQKRAEVVPISIPPLGEQLNIVDTISKFDSAVTYSEETLISAKSLRSGLLSDLLSGEHEIPASYDKVIGAA
ncbi:RMtype1_S_Eco933I-TRD2-CR2_like domain containing protein [Candidatus Nanopelagicaceae bacterium]